MNDHTFDDDIDADSGDVHDGPLFMSTPKRQIWHRVTDDDECNSDTDSKHYDGDNDDDDDNGPSSPVHKNIKCGTEKLLLEAVMMITLVVAWMEMLMMLQDNLYSPITLVTRMSTVSFIAQIVLTYF